MNLEKQPVEPRAAVGRGTGLQTLFRAIGAAVLVAVGAVTYAHLAGGNGLGFAQSRSEAPTDAERQQRITAFASQGPLVLRLVEEANVGLAVDSMGLPPAAKGALLADVQPTPEALRARHAPVRLAWITLWDTDVEDGDVVRIDSHGYSRTVTLTKRGTTFAVPVSADGIIKVTGISDGDGGGITVGLASGVEKAVFPIMSPGQTLGLSVTTK